MVEKRGRGRPLGAEINDDQFLNAVADILVRRDAKTSTAAMRKVLAVRNDWKAASPDAMLRRLQAKWKGRRIALLAAAEQRLAQQTEPVTLVDVLVTFERLRLALRAPETLMAFRRFLDNVERVAAPFRAIRKSQEEFQRRISVIHEMTQVPNFTVPHVPIVREN